MAITIDVVNLKRRVVGQQAVARIRPALLPENFAIEVHSGETADVVEGIAAHARDVLGNQHVELAIAIQIAKACVAPGAKLWRVELLP